jgi:hypothetical protein
LARALLETLFEKWAGETWERQLSNARVPTEIAEVDLTKLTNHLAKLRAISDYSEFRNRRVTGSIAQGWKDLNRHSPYFQDSYNYVVSRFPDSWTPADYLVHFAASCKAGQEYMAPYDLGRAVRNLPSFVREESLLQACRNAGLQTSVPTANENFLDHADLYIETDEGTFTIWSFINTTKARKSVIYKLFNRGHDLTGVHVLAPIDMEQDAIDIHNWKIVDTQYAARLAAELRLEHALNIDRTLALARLGFGPADQFTVLDSSHVNSIRRSRGA